LCQAPDRRRAAPDRTLGPVTRHNDLVVCAREQERRRLACDLHDDCGQHLTALRLHLDAWRASPPGAQHGDRLERAIALAAALDRSLDALAHGLRPPPLDLGPGQAVAAYARRWSARTGIAVDVRGAGAWDGGVPDEVAVQLYRTVQEGLNNVARHAAATRVVIRLARTASELSLTVVDDGVGFRNAAAAPRRGSGGFGLVSLQERAAWMRGTLEIVSAPGCGTTLSLCVPLDQPPAASGRRPRSARRACLPAPA
jgi:signal transduction histidine kinase